MSEALLRCAEVRRRMPLTHRRDLLRFAGSRDVAAV
jgi:hypothetical protein